MEAGQSPIGIGRVVECHRRPIARVVASFAGGGEGNSYVTRIRRSGEIRLVAAVAIRRQGRVVVIRVALRAS